jgi:uncharacterized LabA/DUF88 family protein
VDGQNLFYSAKEAFGYQYPNYDPLLLAKKVCENNNWDLVETRFYTGIPDKADSPFWNHFWVAKLAVMGTRGIITFSRSLRYRNQAIELPNGKTTTALIGQEKGVDIRIALDVVRLALSNTYDVALVFSQDQDLSEVADEVRMISSQQQRWIKVACAFPISPTSRNTRGINKTEWIKIDRATYDACIDPHDYRKKMDESVEPPEPTQKQMRFRPEKKDD